MRPSGHLELIHFGHQCPWTESTKVNFEKIAVDSNCSFCSTNFHIGEREGRTDVFFPFNILWKNTITRTSPVFEDDSLGSLIESSDNPLGMHPEALPPGDLELIETLSSSTIEKSIVVCCNGEALIGKKKEWYSKNSTKYQGYVGSAASGPKVILEFVLAIDSPYSVIPKKNEALHILCLYSNDDSYDYRHEILKRFIDESHEKKIKEIYVISGLNGDYPNGPMSFFESFGFKKEVSLGSMPTSLQGIDEVLLMKKNLGEV